MNEKNSVLKLIFLTIFPEVFQNYFNFSIQKKAREIKCLETEIYNIRDYAKDRKVDDYQYGGGSGMVMKIEPLVNALNDIKMKLYRENKDINPYIILLNPQAKVFKQIDVQRLLKKKNLIFVSGRYEGIDKRFSNYVDEELSIGEFITMGGELPALIISETLIRAIPGLIKEESFQNETFFDGSFDYDCYTRPEEFDNLKVPSVLLSGNHKEIKEWRFNNSFRKKIK
ncbi:MAG TPA: tRNA (guanosine(37)-N1)-methyltransferase TrmD [Mycoplasmatales bacterium]|jgi:tRNA (guanine37-N1)-methyltransferase|nr:tRNA (guanosine(37)-N1)-methyltransferase TrmD [Mycoplasmatales bacterium]